MVMPDGIGGNVVGLSARSANMPGVAEAMHKAAVQIAYGNLMCLAEDMANDAGLTLRSRTAAGWEPHILLIQDAQRRALWSCAIRLSDWCVQQSGLPLADLLEKLVFQPIGEQAKRP